jgi:UDP-N-acetyl-D-mannosaminuronic acid transferase (WecB/TagA/CpsF family)
MSSLPAERRKVLGIEFFQGTAREAVQAMRGGGLLVVPAAPALKDIDTHMGYREALLHADLALADSSFMVLVWNRLQHDCMTRVSGLEYLRVLLEEPRVQTPGNTLWIMADEVTAERNLSWLGGQGIYVPAECVYLAPMYGEAVDDAALLELVERLHPEDVIVTVGGGVQERLGYFLKQRLSYLPSIHCVGAAIAFLSGAQVKIPRWADKLYLGWLFRSCSEPSRFIPRYWSARKLLGLVHRYRENLPVSTV